MYVTQILIKRTTRKIELFAKAVTIKTEEKTIST